MSRFAITISILFLLYGSACSSGTTPSGIAEPEIRVRQSEGQLAVPAGGEIDINLQIDIYNASSELITLKRVGLSSVPTSGIQFEPAGRNLEEPIQPGDVETIDLWVRATNLSTSRGTSVTVRGTAVFAYSGGTFRTVFMEPVVESNTPLLEPR